MFAVSKRIWDADYGGGSLASRRASAERLFARAYVFGSPNHRRKVASIRERCIRDVLQRAVP